MFREQVSQMINRSDDQSFASLPYPLGEAYCGMAAPALTYNIVVSVIPPPPPPDQPAPARPPRAHILKREAAGFLIIGTIIFILTLARYWHHIAWGAR
jgi:hypothetical protein